MNPRKQILGLFLWLAVAFVAAAAGAVASVNAGDFYAQLSRPSWAPPGSVFGPVWSILYTMMAISAWLVWRQGGWARQRTGLWLFLVQLAVNVAWSWLFFVWRLGAIATLDVLMLWGLVAWTTIDFSRRRRLAGALLVPYLCWVTFASALCIAVWRMNPGQL